MVIKIPSKNIYSKDNQKVISNQVKGVEAQIKEPIFSVDENIANTTAIENGFQPSELQYEINDRSYGIAGTSYRANYDAFAYISLTPTYVQRKIRIEKQLLDGKVLSIIGGEYNGIKIAYSGTIVEGTATGSLNYNRNASQSKYITVIGTPQIETTPTSYIKGGYDLSNKTHDENKYIYNTIDPVSGEVEIKVNVEIDLDNLSNVNSVQAVEFSEYYELYLTILAGLKTIKAGGGTQAPSSTGNNFTSPLSGEYIEYIPSTVTVSISGEIYHLDLQDKTLTLGSDKNVISFSGNELIQSTTTPSIEETYQKVIDEWKYGKELATLRLDINDFYDENNNLVISPNEQNLPMTFNLDDIVIPYVFGANGEDKPMSLYKDGTPKQFKVISMGVAFDGGVWQDLVVREILNPNET